MSHNIILAGGSGFIGKVIKEEIQINSRKDKITCFSSKECDLADQESVRQYFDKITGKESIFIFIAAILSNRQNDVNSLKTNTNMAINVCSLLSSGKISHLIYLSTVDVYGRNSLCLPLNEESEIQPESYYAVSKYVSEEILKVSCKKNDIPCTILRLPGVFGLNDPHNGIIKKLVQSSLTSVSVYNAEKKMDLIYNNDIGEVIHIVITRQIYGTFNVVSGNAITINQIIEIISKWKTTNVVIDSSRDDDSSDLVFDSKKFQKYFPNIKLTSVKEGIKQLFQKIG